MILIQNGDAPHFSLSLHGALNDSFHTSWIGRNDLNPSMDFLFWDYFKNIVYSETFTDVTHLIRQSIAATESLTPEMLQKT